MFPNNPINEDYRIQSLNLRFNFAPEEAGELPVYVTSIGDNTQYFVKFAYNPHLTFNQIRTRLREGHFTILTKNQDIFKIRIQEVEAEFLSISKLEINDLKEVNDQTIGGIKEMLDEQKVHIANEIEKLEINQLKETIRKIVIKQTDFEKALELQNVNFNTIKGEIKNSVERQKEFRTIIQTQNDEVENIKNKIERYRFLIYKSIEEVKKINEESFIYEIKKLHNEMKSFESQKNNAESKNEFRIKFSKQENKVSNYETDLKEKFEKNEETIERKEESINKNKSLKSEKNEQNNKEEIKSFFNFFSNKIDKKNNANNSFRWSEELKSKGITINGNSIIRTAEFNNYYEFCLLDPSISNKIKYKELYAIKIKKKTNWISLGVCLKSKMLKENFNDKNINWEKTGHGLYIISSGGCCFSHSEKDFNLVKKSFVFGENDVILIKYDLINDKLKFNKNNNEYFEMPTITPEKNDALHLCIALCGENNEVEMLETLPNSGNIE